MIVTNKGAGQGHTYYGTTTNLTARGYLRRRALESLDVCPVSNLSKETQHQSGRRKEKARTYPREPFELLLVSRRQLSVDRGQGRLLASELLVEVAGIGAPVDGWEVWRRNTLVEDVLPADISEEGLALDLDGIVLARTQPPLRVPSEKLQMIVSDITQV
jgi:hypothetical protein